ncbi:MerR family transcriptional regulator [Desulforudis sp. 1088]|uniref:MerR family transcriptional regulator n=1 Tax=unclassified Candidatus Desulforudis TaxID=2635950 RepID=UPI003CE4C819
MPVYKRDDLAQRALGEGLDLGRNPVRTIRYYSTLGLLPPPNVPGPFRPACYNSGHLEVLRVIEKYKSQGVRLQDIRLRLDTWVGWKSSAPAEAAGVVPVTREETAVLLSRALAQNRSRREVAKLINESLAGVDGKPVFPGLVEGCDSDG